MTIKRLLLFFAVASFIPASFGQLSTGLVAGNYSGSLSGILNPSLMANSKLKADIVLFAAHGHFNNNYFYIPSPEANFQRIVFGKYNFPYHEKPYGVGERNVHTYYDDPSEKNIYVQNRVIGPSAMFSYRDNVFSVRWGARVVSSTRRLPYDIANFSYYGMDFKPQQNVYYIRDNYEMASMAWWDISFGYATVFKRSHTNHWSVGISAGPVFGYAGAYLTGKDTRYIAYNDSILNVDLLNAEMGFSLPVDYETDHADFTHPLIRGFGWGMDIGLTWQWRNKPYQKKFPGNFYNKTFEDYKLKVGFSVMDIGWVRFGKNAEKHVYNGVSNNYINVNELEYDNIRNELEATSEIFYGDPEASLADNKFKIFLPAAFSLQTDYHIVDWWYVSGILVVPVWFTEPGIERPVILAITPRFESEFFEVNIPIVVSDFQGPYVGFSIRFAGLTVGSDRLGAFFSRNDFTGADLYISYKINLQNNGKNPFTSKGACFNNWRCELKKAQR